ncbi:hypothetical protein D3C81_1435580 [compost metagenome]
MLLNNYYFNFVFLERRINLFNLFTKKRIEEKEYEQEELNAVKDKIGIYRVVSADVDMDESLIIYFYYFNSEGIVIRESIVMHKLYLDFSYEELEKSIKERIEAMIKDDKYSKLKKIKGINGRVEL